MAKTRYCESINANEFSIVFSAAHDSKELDYEIFTASPTVVDEVRDFLNVGFGFIPNPECMEDDCGCCKCGLDGFGDDSHDVECLGESEPAECRSGLLWYYVPENVDQKMVYNASLKALRKMGATSRNGYQIFGPESLCFCGKCDRVDLEQFEEFLMEEFEAITDAEPAKRDNTGLGLENSKALLDMYNGGECVLPDGSLLTYDTTTENIVCTNPEGIVSLHHVPNLKELILSYGGDNLEDIESEKLKKAFKSTGAQRYPNSTVDAIWKKDAPEAVSYKSFRATLLDNSSNQLLHIGKDELTDTEVTKILSGKHAINRKFEALNTHYALPYSQRPSHPMLKNNRYMSLIPNGRFVTPEGGLAANGVTIHLPNTNDDSKSIHELMERINGFPLRFADGKVEGLLNLAMECGQKNTVGFKGWGTTPQILRGGEFMDVAKTDSVTATKHLLLTRRVHPSESEGRSADCVQFLAKSPTEGVACVLELKYESADFIWQALVKNISLDTPSGRRDSPQFGVIRTPDGKAYPFMSFPLKLRLEHGFKPEKYS